MCSRRSIAISESIRRCSIKIIQAARIRCSRLASRSTSCSEFRRWLRLDGFARSRSRRVAELASLQGERQNCSYRSHVRQNVGTHTLASVATGSFHLPFAQILAGPVAMNRSLFGLTLLLPLLVIGLANRATADEVVTLPSFARDVQPLLTKLGCNQGACHGKLAGQNGFRLSLRGYAPDWDHFWITREFSSRRINPANPNDSLLIQKPLGTKPHAGGRLMAANSREQHVLTEWLKAGAPGPVKDEPTVAKLTISPTEHLLAVQQTQPLTVTAKYTDGRQRDVTWLTVFTSNDSAVAEIDRKGVITAHRSGETAIVASFDGQVAVAIATIPFGEPKREGEAPAEPTARPGSPDPAANDIDTHVFAKLAALRIEPSAPASDAEFLRRVFLDTIGTLPTADEVRGFLADTSIDKRTKVIDALLQRPEFVDFWTLQFADLFQNRKERDHDVRGSKGVRQFHAWLRSQIAVNRPWDQLCQEVLTTEGSTDDKPAIGYFIVTVGENGDADRSEVVASVAQAFLGTRIGCAQCHNHPLEKYTQDDYYHFAAFFSRMRFDRKPSEQSATRLFTTTGEGLNFLRDRENVTRERQTIETSLPGTSDEAKLTELKKKQEELIRRLADLDKRLAEQDARKVGVGQPRTGQFIEPRPLDRSPVEIAPGTNPRTVLASWMTNPSNEFFSGAIINRLWKHFLGVGLVEPVDDLRATNPPSNPALFKSLQRELVQSGFDLRHVMRRILNSRTYQLTSATTASNATDTRFYSHYIARRLPAEVLLDAVSQTTAVPESFAGYPLGLRAIQLPDPSIGSYFLATFGRSDRVTACACERQGEITLPQLLQMQNGDAILQKIAATDGRLTELLKATTDDSIAVETLFLTCFNRQPTPAEMQKVASLLSGEETREEKFRDLFWALLNSKEFAFNH